ncbi:c-type cytochrome [Bartonella sp. HY761]|uniref:c-type cytochrome n=1 Tax=Bartonella sp. HY761 TaxID=2979330 RepID=UPI0022098FA0|nr:cytochrome c family protein [Bartonella sp. HY761]UXN06162.1 cytochrome c family protein [Bartonella sp. HY761]
MFRISVATINNFILICLLWFIVLITLYYVSETIYSNPDPIKSENSLVQEPSANNIADKTTTTTKTLETRLATGDIEHGRKLFGECGLCHIPAENGPNRLGPNLWQIVGRPAGTVNGFNYSSAMRQLGQSGAKWNYQSLDAFLSAPQRTLKGTIMTYKGMKDAQDRADLLLYLRSLSDNPQDLPKVDKAIDSEDQ